jgi:hypothetical protein
MASQGKRVTQKNAESSIRKATSSRSAKHDDLTEHLTELKKNDPELKETRLWAMGSASRVVQLDIGIPYPKVRV